jgi:hypothetical protein
LPGAHFELTFLSCGLAGSVGGALASPLLFADTVGTALEFSGLEGLLQDQPSYAATGFVPSFSLLFIGRTARLGNPLKLGNLEEGEPGKNTEPLV